MRLWALSVCLLFGACAEAEPSKTETTTVTGGVGNPAGSPATGGAGTGPAGSGGATAGTAGSGTGTYCDAWVARLRECGSLGPGRYAGCANYGDAAETCELGCITSASCAAVVDYFCAAGDEIFDCQGACIGEMPVLCSDGMRFPYVYRCDGLEDCAGGEDEAGCTETGTVKCRNVAERIAGVLVCNGVVNCSDGSDEPQGCSDEFTCADGVPLPVLYACDGIVDCLDGSDEPSDCAQATCE
jgi:hypothetical protein